MNPRFEIWLWYDNPNLFLWHRTLPYCFKTNDQFVVKVAGSGRLTLRNRPFLRSWTLERSYCWRLQCFFNHMEIAVLIWIQRLYKLLLSLYRFSTIRFCRFGDLNLYPMLCLLWISNFLGKGLSLKVSMLFEPPLQHTVYFQGVRGFWGTYQ